jgi:hypothetical protein
MIFNKLIKWHFELVDKVHRLTGLSNYQIIWISFLEGLLIGILIGYFLFN